jgi:hypothetical protein
VDLTGSILTACEFLCHYLLIERLLRFLLIPGCTRDTSIRVLGFWWWWLFVVPSLRSRRPKGAEKKALDIAFLGTPLISLIAPAATKDTGLIWAGK